ncbi:hypothetical protein AMAG_11468 [Allomyces macrogynus ATCC 38327]|uniref:Mediator of RNA polymerase II transcription subunit 10 n=1 Tax=Allomyces macrogynus (strain ATCC 38327) TaxID=578462 RepID=A0A0L0SX07_ALLM3|nr:hypothetical protein AMAG_11468 [Allomyces macrogynus ATCC 38327]|eukprot:KNE67001.1 hypothetical protein AMAG_11468 [Allomyces macrogynus ATCC 38327]
MSAPPPRPTSAGGSSAPSARAPPPLSRTASVPFTEPDRAVVAPAAAALHSLLATLTDMARITTHYGDASDAQLAETLASYAQQLADLDEYARDHLIDVWVPKAVVDAVDAGANPARVTQNYLESLAAENQFTNGKVVAAGRFRSALEDQLRAAFPDELAAIDQESGAVGTSDSGPAPPPAPGEESASVAANSGGKQNTNETH